MLLSVIVPCFNEEKTIPLFFKEMKKIKQILPLEVEYILIDDGSTDQTLRSFVSISKRDLKNTLFFLFS